MKKHGVPHVFGVTCEKCRSAHPESYVERKRLSRRQRLHASPEQRLKLRKEQNNG